MYNKFFNRYFIVVFVLLLSINYTSYSQTNFNIQDSLALRKLWLDLDGPNWKYPENITEDQKWFNSQGNISGADWLGVSKRYATSIEVAGIQLYKFMVPSSGNVHFRDMKNFLDLQTLTISDVPQVHQFQADSIITNLVSLRYLIFDRNNAVGKLPAKLFQDMTNLIGLSLEGNQLSDTIPNVAIGSATQLTDLNLSHNLFTGNLSPALFGLGNKSGYDSRNISLSHNKLKGITGPVSSGFGYANLYLYLNNNQIEEDNGFVQNFYNNYLTYVGFDISNNKLSPARIASSYYVLNGNTYQGYLRSYTILPQYLGNSTTVDLKDLSNSITVQTDIQDDSYLGVMGYWVNDTLLPYYDNFTYTVNNGKASFTIPAGFFNSNAHMIDGKCTIRPYIYRDPVWDPNVYVPGYAVEFAPVVIRAFQIPKFTLTGLDPFVCKQHQVGGARLKYSLEALGIETTDVGTLSMIKTSVASGVPKDSSFTINLASIPNLLLLKRIEGEVGFKGESCTLKIVGVTLKDKNAVTKACDFHNVLNTTTIGMPNTTVKVDIPDFFCQSYSSITIKVVKPEAGVSYSVKNIGMREPILSADTLFMTTGADFSPQGATTNIEVIADIDGGCAVSLANKNVKVVSYSSPIASVESTSPPTCSSNAVIRIVNTDPDYWYVPYINYEYLGKYKQSGNALGNPIELKIPIYQFWEDFNSSIVITEHKYCGSSSNTYLDGYAFNHTPVQKTVATDSLALIHFVERTGYKPTAKNLQWFGRDIASGVNAAQKPIYLPIKNWEVWNGEGVASIVQTTCGKITGLYLGNEYPGSSAIGPDQKFSLALDSLVELRELDISENDFIGTFDNKKYLGSSNLERLDISYNKFTDESFFNLKDALKNTRIRAYDNNLTFVSLTKVNGNEDSDLMPQNYIDVDTLIEIYEGKPLFIKNPVPDTKDGKLHYFWHLAESNTIISEDRDLYIEHVSANNNGSYVCEMQHEDIISNISEKQARLDYSHPILYLENLRVSVVECNKDIYVGAGEDRSVCSADTVKLSGVIGGNVVNPEFKWTGGTGTFNATTGINSLETAYKPSAADIVAGSVLFRLTMTTDDGNCIYKDSVQIALPATPATPSTIVIPAKCSSDTTHTILNKTTVPKGEYLWYNTSGEVYSNPYDAGNVQSTTTYYVEDRVASTQCASKRTAVVVTVNVSPIAPTIPTAPTICYGAKAVLNKTPTPAKYFWYADSVGGKANANPFTTPNLTKSTNYYLVDSSTTTKCASPRVKLSVTVRPMVPRPDSVAIPAVCEGGTVVLKSNANNATGQFFWYASEVGGASKKQGDLSGVLLTNTSFYVIDSILSTKCASVRRKIDVIVNPRPDTPSAPILSVCKGGATSLLSSGVPTGSFYWYPTPLGGKALVNGTTISGVIADTKYYLSDSNTVTKCASVRKEVPITVVQPVLPTVLLSIKDTNICKSETVKFETKSTSAGSNPSFNWMVNGVSVDSQGDTYTTNTLLDGDRVSVVMTSDATCITQKEVNSDTVTMEVVTSVVPEVILEDLTNVICEGAEAVFSAIPVHEGNNPTYEWKINSNSVGLGTEIFKTAVLKDGDVVSVVLTSSESCASIPTAVSNDLEVVVRPLVSPSVQISTPALEICRGQQVYFGLNALNGGLAPKLEWSVNGDLTSNNVEFSSETLADGDVVSLKLISSEFCLVDSIALSNELTFKVNELTEILGISTPDSICEGGTASTIVEAIGANLSYKWTENESEFKNPSLFSGINSSQLSLVQGDTSVNGNFYMVEVIGACGTEHSSAVPFVIQKIPRILTQPVATATCASGVVPFEVIATGSEPLSYQWYDNSDLIVDDTTFTGATTSKLILAFPDFSLDGHQYSVKVSNACPTTATSAPAVLTVTDVVDISVSISTTDSNICVGDTVSFVAKAINAGINPTYSWRINGSELYTFTPVFHYANFENGDQVDCRLTVYDACVVNNSAVSNLINMKVNAVVPEFVEINPGGRCDTGSVVLSALATQGELYWYTSTDTLNSLHVGNSFATPVLTRSTDYYIQALFEACESPKVLVTATVEKKPQVNAGTDQIICRSTDFIPLEQVAITGPLAWEVLVGNGDLQVVEAIPSGYYVSMYDSFLDSLVFRMYSLNEICESVADTVTYSFGIPQSVPAGTEPIIELDSLIFTNLIVSNFPANTSYDITQPKTWSGVKTACGNITEMHLSQKGLNGTLKGIDQLYQLQAWDMSKNQIDSLDFELGNISSRIKQIDLSDNNIVYPNPIFLGYSDLDTLNLSNNSFTDTITFYNFSPEFINLNHTKLAGLDFQFLLNQVPLYDFATTHLDIAGNGLVQNHIGGISLLDSLRYLDASHNQFEGLMSDMSLSNTFLEYLDLSHNKIRAAFTISTKLSKLSHLDLSHNALDALDATTPLGLFTGLSYIDLGNNRFENLAFDQDLSKLTNLRYFAIDSNAVGNTEVTSGITALPILPLNSGLLLSVQNNHLQFDDLQPYKTLFEQTGSVYSPQYDSVDQSYVLKPVVGANVKLSTSLTGDKNTYVWKRKKAQQTVILSNTIDVQFKFAASSDTGQYFVEIGNTDFPGLTYVRRAITLHTCDIGYLADVQLLNSMACAKADTLMAKLTYGDLSFPKSLSYHWNFEGWEIQDAFQPKLTVFTSGKYYFSAYDSASFCLINSNVVSINNLGDRDPVLKLSLADSAIINLTTYTNVPKFQWYINGLPIAGATDAKLRVYYNGKYQLSITSGDNCVSTSKYLEIKDFPQTFVRAEHAVNDKGQVILHAGGAVQVYPNPAIDQFRVEGLVLGTELSLVSPQGHIVLEQVADKHTIDIKTSDLSKGVYILNIKYQNSNKWEKIVIQ